jgi:hypothetical protein
MRVLLALLLALTPILSHAAFGVNTNSVKKWNDKKLCKQYSKFLKKEEKAWEAAVVNSEIYLRRLDLQTCSRFKDDGTVFYRLR